MKANLTWRPTNAPVASSRTDDIWFVDPQVGWAVNSNGQIVKTTDGFSTWTEQFHDSEVYFRCIEFASPTRGWAGTLTDGKLLYHTTDGGTTWKQVSNLPALAPSAICGLCVVSERVVYASGTNFPDRPPRVMKTTDGGETWQGLDLSEHASLLVDIYFVTPDRGWVVGGKVQTGLPLRRNVKPVVLFTEDGGRTWVNQTASLLATFPLGEWGWKIQFLNDRVGFVSLENFTKAAILKTADGGGTWERVQVLDPQGNANLEGVGFLDPDRGWVGGWGSADFSKGFTSETTDGGRTWRDANEVGRFINRFRFFGNPVSLGYASGRTVYKYSDEPPPPAPLAATDPRERRVFESSDRVAESRPVGFPIQVPSGTARFSLRIWDRFGELVRVLVDEATPAPGAREVVWDLADNLGHPLPAGDYIVRVTIDDRSESQILRVRS